MRMPKSLISLLITASTIFHARDWSAYTRFSLGPAWHRFSSYEIYQVNDTGIINFIPVSEILENEFSLMPYLEGKIGTCWGPFNFTFTAGGGLFNNGRGIVNRFLSIGSGLGIQGTNDTRCTAHLLILDTQVGFTYGSDRLGLWINPIIGYVINKEQVNFALLESSNKYRLKNKWQGPYVGCAASWLIFPSVILKPAYKFVFGQVDSHMRTALSESPTFGLTPDTPMSWRRASMFGNLLSLEATCHYSTHWNFGTMISYNNYKNHKPGRVKFGPGNQQFVTGARLERIMWEQIVWDLFLECTY